jgi:hypothetical protein
VVASGRRKHSVLEVRVDSSSVQVQKGQVRHKMCWSSPVQPSRSRRKRKHRGHLHTSSGYLCCRVCDSIPCSHTLTQTHLTQTITQSAEVVRPNTIMNLPIHVREHITSLRFDLSSYTHVDVSRVVFFFFFVYAARPILKFGRISKLFM